MKNIIVSLEEIARAAKTSAEPKKAEEAIRATRSFIQDSKKNKDASKKALLDQLDSELATWQTKLSVLLSEPAARQGIVKHIYYWEEKLKS